MDIRRDTLPSAATVNSDDVYPEVAVSAPEHSIHSKADYRSAAKRRRPPGAKLRGVQDFMEESGRTSYPIMGLHVGVREFK